MSKRALEPDDLGTDPERVAKIMRVDSSGEATVWGSDTNLLLPDVVLQIMVRLQVEEFDVFVQTHPYYQTPPGISLRQRIEHYMVRRDFRSPLTREPYRMVTNYEAAINGGPYGDLLRTQDAIRAWQKDAPQSLEAYYRAGRTAAERQTSLVEMRANVPSIGQQYERRAAWKHVYQACSSVCALAMMLLPPCIGFPALTMAGDPVKQIRAVSKDAADFASLVGDKWPDAFLHKLDGWPHSVAPILLHGREPWQTTGAPKTHWDDLARVHQKTERAKKGLDEWLRRHPLVREEKMGMEMAKVHLLLAGDEAIDWREQAFKLEFVYGKNNERPAVRTGWQADIPNLRRGQWSVVKGTATKPQTSLMTVVLREEGDRGAAGIPDKLKEHNLVVAETETISLLYAPVGITCYVTGIDLDAVLDELIRITLAQPAAAALATDPLAKARAFNTWMFTPGYKAPPVTLPLRYTLQARFRAAWMKQNPIAIAVAADRVGAAAPADVPRMTDQRFVGLPRLMQFCLLPPEIYAKMPEQNGDTSNQGERLLLENFLGYGAGYLNLRPWIVREADSDDSDEEAEFEGEDESEPARAHRFKAKMGAAARSEIKQ